MQNSPSQLLPNLQILHSLTSFILTIVEALFCGFYEAGNPFYFFRSLPLKSDSHYFPDMWESCRRGKLLSTFPKPSHISLFASWVVILRLFPPLSFHIRRWSYYFCFFLILIKEGKIHISCSSPFVGSNTSRAHARTIS